MTLPILKLPVIQFENGQPKRVAAAIIRETALEIRLNERFLVEIACAGLHLEELALGYLQSEGFVDSMDEILRIEVEESPYLVAIATTRETPAAPLSPAIMSSGARKKTKILPGEPLHSSLVVGAAQILNLMEQLLAATEIHEITRGTHCSALAVPERLVCTREDIGRHNTIDMLAGYSLKNNLERGAYLLLTTGRISSEIVGKAWIQGIPVIISHSAPTSGAIDLARKAGITLIGYVRNSRMSIYVNEQRVQF